MFEVYFESFKNSVMKHPSWKINQCLTDINRFLTDSFKI